MKMKKQLIILTTLLLSVFAMRAESLRRIISFEELPKKAQTFVGSYFNGLEITFVRMEVELTKTEYTVRFGNGMEVEFNSNGDWVEVESHLECLPKGFLDGKILSFLDQHHKGHCLHEIARQRHKIELELSNGLQLIFKKNGEFLRYND